VSSVPVRDAASVLGPRLRGTQAWPAVPPSVARYDKGMSVGMYHAICDRGCTGRPGRSAHPRSLAARDSTRRGRSHPGYMHAWYQSKTVGWLNRSSDSDEYVFCVFRCIIGIYAYGGTRHRVTGLPLARFR
jgi:hypothetical protein